MNCSVENCEGVTVGHGLCNKHYKRWRRHGDTATVAVRGPSKLPAKSCTITGCERDAVSRGWCTRHYLRWRKYGDPLVIKRSVSQDGPLATFHANVDKRGPDECWPWQRPPMRAGYGQIQWLDGKVWYAHRVAYLLAYGEIPVSDDPGDPIEIDHLCHTLRCTADPCPHRLCVNPAHLEAKTRSRNTARTMFWKPRRGWRILIDDRADT